MKRHLLAGLVLAAVPFCLWGQSISPKLPDSIIPYDVPAARIRGIGGYHAAYNNDISALFANPAALAGIEERQASYAGLALTVIDFDILSVFVSGLSDLREKFESQARMGIQINMDFAGPLALGMVRKNLGWGIFNVSRFYVHWDKESLWTADMRTSEEVIGVGGGGFRMFDTGSFTGDIGLSLKLLYRATYRPKLHMTEIKYFFEGINKDFFETQMGIGSSIGTVFTSQEVFSFSLVYHDPYSPVYTNEFRNTSAYYKQQAAASGIIPLTPRMAFGIAWKPDMSWTYTSISDIIVMADITDIFEFVMPRGLDRFLYTNVGLEIRLLEVLTLRAGLEGLLPSFGLGLNFTLFTLEAAFFMKEAGESIGDFSLYSAALDILWRF